MVTPLPASWTAWRSAALLMCHSCYLTAPDASTLRRQLELIRWELEKYGPAFCEPPAAQVIDEAMAYLEKLLPGDPVALGVRHGSEILRRRGREALHLTLSGCARVAALQPKAPPQLPLLHAIETRAVSEVAVNDTTGAQHYLGEDEARDMALDPRLPELPQLLELGTALAQCVAVLARPADWTPAHALGFVVYAAHACDREGDAPVHDTARQLLGHFGAGYGVTGGADELLARGRELFARTGGGRFVVLRAVEDQLMSFFEEPLEIRDIIVRIVNVVTTQLPLTPARRAIVTATMAVLATSPKAEQRPRQCPAWPA